MKNTDGDHLSLAPPQGLEIVNSFDVNKVLQANIIYLNKKRKFQAEQTGLPLSKHKCCDRKLNSDSYTPSDEIPIKNYFEIQVSKGNSVCKTTNHESELESVKDSSSFDEDNMDYSSSASVSNEAKQVSENLISASERSVTLSLNISNDSFSTDTYSHGSRLISPYNGEEYSSDNNCGQDALMNYEESFLEFGCNADCNGGIENESSGTEQCQDKEIEEMLYYNALLPKHAPLSGELSLIQGNQEGTKKPTIDKEFEEYFSMLML